MEFRIGVHLGEARAEGERLYGDAVNVAARLEALAEPRGLCISDDVLHQVQRRLELEFEDLGPQEVKNIPNPVHVYRVREASASSVKAGPAQRRVAPRVVAAFVGTALLAIAAAAYLTLRGGTPTESGAPLTSIAVLPFDDLSPGGDQRWLADGLAEELIWSGCGSSTRTPRSFIFDTGWRTRFTGEEETKRRSRPRSDSSRRSSLGWRRRRGRPSDRPAFLERCGPRSSGGSQ
jgi:hypothetical protein